MKIEIAVTCHNFQKRFCWMLSSIIQQKDIIDISINVAYLKDNGNPTTESVLNSFNNYIYYKNSFTSNNIKLQPLQFNKEEDLWRRGIVRNKQLEMSNADWIIYADADMIYPPDYFGKLSTLLSNKFKNDSRVLFSGRYSNEVNNIEEVINKYDYPMFINNAFDIIMQAKGRRICKNIGAGYCQILNVRSLKENGYYINNDGMREKPWTFRSDKQIRQRLGKCKLDLPYQYHLQHLRDKDVGKHLEIQR